MLEAFGTPSSLGDPLLQSLCLFLLQTPQTTVEARVMGDEMQELIDEGGFGVMDDLVRLPPY